MFSVMWSEHCSYKSSQAAAAHAAHRRQRGARGPGRERRRRAHRGRPGGRVQARVAQPSQRGRARTRAPRPASAASCATSSPWAPDPSPCSTRSSSVTRPIAARDTSSRRGARRRRLRQLRRRADGRRRARLPPDLRRQPAGQRDGRRASSRSATCARRARRPRQPRGAVRLHHRARRHRRRVRAGQRHVRRGSGAKRPSVQVGDPFAEKLLIEASLELIERGLVEGLQDLGAAGITCAVVGDRRPVGTGIRVDLDAIPRREADMEPFEVMISESQERMLAIVSRDAAAATCWRSAALGPARRGHRPGHR